jgi:hypothetical protein
MQKRAGTKLKWSLSSIPELPKRIDFYMYSSLKYNYEKKR